MRKRVADYRLRTVANATAVTNAIDYQLEPVQQETPQLARRIASLVYGLVFYSALIIAVLFVYGLQTQSGAPRMIMGYSAMTVLTGSMQSEIPVGSLIVTKHVDATTIKIGDDISFMYDANTVVTHRVVGINENYADSGKRGFITQGINNLEPDKEIVIADNVVGVVIFHNYQIGIILSYIQANPILVGIIVISAGGLVFALRVVVSEPKINKRNTRKTIDVSYKQAI
ncbi:MAG: signal peptidase I [Coriobacteriales bacterium]|nr:signal peptidase I [Coriobacteriales bacterium]